MKGNAFNNDNLFDNELKKNKAKSGNRFSLNEDENYYSSKTREKIQKIKERLMVTQISRIQRVIKAFLLSKKNREPSNFNVIFKNYIYLIFFI
jgi:hypothetical protein